MTSNPPARDAEQRQDALHEALKARQERARLLREVHTTRVSVFEVLDLGRRGIGDTIAGHIEIGDLLMALPGIGPVTAATMLMEAGLGADVDEHLDMLTNRESDALVQELHNWFDSHAPHDG
jgi:transposase